jgi:hypothetical protein
LHRVVYGIEKLGRYNNRCNTSKQKIMKKLIGISIVAMLVGFSSAANSKNYWNTPKQPN